MTRPLFALTLILTVALNGTSPAAQPAPGSSGPSAKDYPSIQQALDANPGQIVHVPPGDYPITEPLRIKTDNSGLFGTGRIVQTHPDAPILRLENVSGVRLRDLTLTRPEGKQDTEAEAVRADHCQDLSLDNLRVLDNHSRSPAIHLHRCDGVQVRDCLVRNYQRIAVDDRTANPDLGYAFKCLDGTGIGVNGCRGALVRGNRVVEERLLPTPDLKREYDLGRYVKKNEVRGVLAGQRDWEAGQTDNWMQGSAIHIADPEASDFTQVLGNTIENAAQGIDIHADHVIISQNLVNDSLIGMKAMHGARHVLILGNQFAKSTLWSIGLMPGAASHPAQPASDGKPARPANVDGGSIIANNIISEFGQGRSRWVWGENTQGNPLRFDHGQMPDDPPLTDVIVQGNIVYDTNRDGVLIDGQPQVPPPHYQYAVRIESGTSAPRGLHFSNNLFHPGSKGVSNVELTP